MLNSRDRVLKRLDSKTITSKDEGWLMFNVTSALSDWIAFPQENYGLYLRVRCNHFREFPFTSHDDLVEHYYLRHLRNVYCR